MLAAHLSGIAGPETGASDALATALAASTVTVLIHGETGSGKGVIAREIHAESDRRDGPFVVADCSALAASLFESQMFGHVKGAFTGATAERTGLVRAASGGTLFLDEVGELALELQAKLLTLLEDRTVLPVGSERRLGVDVRFIAATHRDLRAMVRTGTFREDLYFRLAVVEIGVAPLRSRRSEIPAMLSALIERKAEILQVRPRRPSQSFVRAVMAYDWPGNIRELGNCVERALVLSVSDELDVSSLPARLLEAIGVGSDGGGTGPGRRLDQIHDMLERVSGNKSEAARRLGMSRRHLYRLLESSQQT